jgi:hypothetical protein
MARRASSLLILIASFLTTPAWSGESITFSVNLIVSDQEATSIGRATYQAPSLCLECRHWGNHRLNGGSASASWNLFPTEIYERRLSEFVPTHPSCYVGFMEGWGTGGFYGTEKSNEKCTPCVLWLDKSGSGSISGAPIGKSSYNCGAGVSLTASPAAGWRFVRWGGSISSTSSSLSFTLDASKTLDAFFEEIDDLPEKDLPDDGSGETTLPPGYVSPILIDLDHNGFQLTGLNDAVLFDLDADGTPNRTSWTAAGVADSFLVLDRNGNGVIDDGQELFGNATRLLSGHTALNGYLALRELDANGDEAIDASDAIWPSLQVWTDRNHDAVSQSSELQSLEEAGIDLLDTRYAELRRRDRYGNLFRFKARALVGDKQSKTYDVFFRQDMR